MPEILLLVLPQDLAFVGDERCDVEERIAVFFNDSSGDDADV
jgi:hypothetical protein